MVCLLDPWVHIETLKKVVVEDIVNKLRLQVKVNYELCHKFYYIDIAINYKQNLLNNNKYKKSWINEFKS